MIRREPCTPGRADRAPGSDGETSMARAVPTLHTTRPERRTVKRRETPRHATNGVRQGGQ
jgi:hypothetical protein